MLPLEYVEVSEYIVGAGAWLITWLRIALGVFCSVNKGNKAPVSSICILFYTGVSGDSLANLLAKGSPRDADRLQ